MPLINQVVKTLEHAKPPRTVDLVLTDGDGTIFPHGTDRPFPGALDYLEALHPHYLALVSGNKNPGLAEARREAINANDKFIPKVSTIIKSGLFRMAIDAAVESVDVQCAAVLGNRWFLDVASARIELRKRGIKDNFGVYVTQEPSPEFFDRFVTNPLQFAGATAIKPFGLDQLIRSREQLSH